MQSRQESGSRRTTACSFVELGESRSFAGQAIDVRRFHLAAATTNVRVTHVVGHDQNDVGTLSSRLTVNRAAEDGSGKTNNELCNEMLH